MWANEKMVCFIQRNRHRRTRTGGLGKSGMAHKPEDLSYHKPLQCVMSGRQFTVLVSFVRPVG